MKIDKSWYIKPKNVVEKKCAGGIVIRKENNKLLVALLKDKKYIDFILPKGEVEKGEKYKETAVREIAEETGLSKVSHLCFLGIKERLSFEKNVWVKTFYYLFSTKQEKGKQHLEKGEEDYVLKWFKIDKLPPMFWPEQRELIKKSTKKIKKVFTSK